MITEIMHVWRVPSEKPAELHMPYDRIIYDHAGELTLVTWNNTVHEPA